MEAATNRSVIGIGILIAVLAGIAILGLQFFPPLYVVVALLAVPSIIIIFRKPEMGIYLSILAIALVESNTLLFLILAFCIMVYLIRYIADKDLDLPKTAGYFPLALYIFFIVLTTITSVEPFSSAVDGAVVLVSVCLYIILAKELKTREQINVVIMVLAVAAVIASLYGIYQYLGGAQTDASWVDQSENPNLKTRVFSTFTNPNVFAEYLVLILPLLIGLFLSTRSWLKKAMYCALGAPIILAILLTASRSSWLGLAFAMFLIVLMTKKSLLLLIIPFIFIAPYIVPSYVLQRLSTISFKDSSIQYRLRIFESTFLMIRKYWATGVGLGTDAFRRVLAQYWGTTGVIPYHSHNSYLQLIAETGIGGFLSFGIFVIRKIQSGVLSVKRYRDRYLTPVTICCVSSIAAIALSALAEHVFFKPKIIYTFWIVAGILSASVNQASNVSGETTCEQARNEK